MKHVEQFCFHKLYYRHTVKSTFGKWFRSLKLLHCSCSVTSEERGQWYRKTASCKLSLSQLLLWPKVSERISNDAITKRYLKTKKLLVYFCCCPLQWLSHLLWRPDTELSWQMHSLSIYSEWCSNLGVRLKTWISVLKRDLELLSLTKIDPRRPLLEAKLASCDLLGFGLQPQRFFDGDRWRRPILFWEVAAQRKRQFTIISINTNIYVYMRDLGMNFNFSSGCDSLLIHFDYQDQS